MIIPDKIYWAYQIVCGLNNRHKLGENCPHCGYYSKTLQERLTNDRP